MLSLRDVSEILAQRGICTCYKRVTFSEDGLPQGRIDENYEYGEEGDLLESLVAFNRYLYKMKEDYPELKTPLTLSFVKRGLVALLETGNIPLLPSGYYSYLYSYLRWAKKKPLNKSDYEKRIKGHIKKLLEIARDMDLNPDIKKDGDIIISTEGIIASMNINMIEELNLNSKNPETVISVSGKDKSIGNLLLDEEKACTNILNNPDITDEIKIFYADKMGHIYQTHANRVDMACDYFINGKLREIEQIDTALLSLEAEDSTDIHLEDTKKQHESDIKERKNQAKTKIAELRNKSLMMFMMHSGLKLKKGNFEECDRKLLQILLIENTPLKHKEAGFGGLEYDKHLEEARQQTCDYFIETISKYGEKLFEEKNNALVLLRLGIDILFGKEMTDELTSDLQNSLSKKEGGLETLYKEKKDEIYNLEKKIRELETPIIPGPSSKKLKLSEKNQQVLKNNKDNLENLKRHLENKQTEINRVKKELEKIKEALFFKNEDNVKTFLDFITQKKEELEKQPGDHKKPTTKFKKAAKGQELQKGQKELASTTKLLFNFLRGHDEIPGILYFNSNLYSYIEEELAEETKLKCF